MLGSMKCISIKPKAPAMAHLGIQRACMASRVHQVLSRRRCVSMAASAAAGPGRERPRRRTSRSTSSRGSEDEPSRPKLTGSPPPSPSDPVSEVNEPRQSTESVPKAGPGKVDGTCRGEPVVAASSSAPGSSGGGSGDQQQDDRPHEGVMRGDGGVHDAGDDTSGVTAASDVIRTVADGAQSVIAGGAAALQQGVRDAAGLAAEGIASAEEAVEGGVRGLAAAAEAGVNTVAGTASSSSAAAAAAAPHVVPGAAPGAPQALSQPPTSGNGNGNSAAASSPADSSTAVRLPASMSWANAAGPASTRPPAHNSSSSSSTQEPDEEELEAAKVAILAAVASLDRGLAANVREASDVDRLCRRLESGGGAVSLKWAGSRSRPGLPVSMEMLCGVWRLIYSSGFNGGSLGGSRPGPPAPLVPAVLGQVYQDIRADGMQLDNIVELLLAVGLPRLPLLTQQPREPEPAPGLRITLRHSFEVDPPATVTIVFESTSAKAIGPDLLQGLPSLVLPELPEPLRPPRGLRSASFNVTYLDASMRITRGDRGELRIYLRDEPFSAAPPADYDD